MYASVLDVGRCAEMVSIFPSIKHDALCRYSPPHTQFRTGRKRPLPSLAVGVSAGDVASVRAAVEEV